MDERRPILIGYDESPASKKALRWAVQEALLRQSPVLVSHAWQWPYPLQPVEPGVLAQVEHVAGAVVDDGVRRARELAPQADIRAVLARGTASAVLLDLAREAELTVLGFRGLGGFEDLEVGSAAVQVSAHSVRPVVIVRGEAPPQERGRVVVGVDGSPASLAAFEFALSEAALRDGTVTALCCWPDGGQLLNATRLPFVDPQALRKEAETRFHDMVALAARRHPHVAVGHEVVTERPQRAMIDASKDATLLVLGNRGSDSPTCPLLGPVAQAALAEAWCPVALTPPTRRA